MSLQRKTIAIVGALLLPFAFTSAASALSVTCTGVPAATSITWSATAQDGVAPYAYLWGNGSTTNPQTVAVTPGTHTMTIQVTDASSTVAASTCSATVSQAAPTITSFIATPASITTGQSSVLSWIVGNASSTSINNGVGTVSGTSTTVTPAVTTIYTLTATNPGGSSVANVTVTVGTTTGSVSAQIQALLNQIAALRARIAELLLSGGSGGTATTTPPVDCFNFWRSLKHGDIGDDVKELQQQLVHDDPTIFPPGLITGFFGPKTQAAVKMWQRRYGIDPIGTGFFGMKSRGHFTATCTNGDKDQDGIRNSEDSDDDNDGTSDWDDKFPFNPNATSTHPRWDDDDDDDDDRKPNNRGNGNSGSNSGKGNGNDDDDD